MNTMTRPRRGVKPLYQRKAVVRAFARNRVPLGARLLLEDLVRHADSDGVCRRAPAAFARDLERSLRTIREWERSLASAGLIERSWTPDYVEGGSTREIRILDVGYRQEGAVPDKEHSQRDDSQGDDSGPTRRSWVEIREALTAAGVAGRFRRVCYRHLTAKAHASGFSWEAAMARVARGVRALCAMAARQARDPARYVFACIRDDSFRCPEDPGSMAFHVEQRRQTPVGNACGEPPRRPDSRRNFGPGNLTELLRQTLQGAQPCPANSPT